MQELSAPQKLSPLRIGVLVSGARVSGQIHVFLEWARAEPQLEICCLHAPAARESKFIAGFLMRVIEVLEMRKLRRHAKLAGAAKQVPVLCVKDPARPLDIVLDFGLTQSSPAMAMQTNLGILSLRMDGLREVLHREDSSGFLLQHFSPSGQASTLGHGHFVTQFYYLLNRAALEAKSLACLKRVLLQIAQHGAVPAGAASAPHAADSFAPGAWQMLHYIIVQVLRLASRRYRQTVRRESERWGIAYVAGSWQKADFAAATRIPNPPQHFLADPFVVAHAGAHFCFVEDYDNRAGKGVISVYQLSDSGAAPLGVALAEPFHLSFPYVFEVGGTYYMCPETAQNNDIQLYACEEFPLKWKLCRVLVQDVQAVDTLLFRHENRWWLCTTQDSSGAGERMAELYYYYADDLLEGAWTPHAQNPVLVDSRKGRNGGLLYAAGEIYRVAQRQGFDRYGKAASVQRIVTLTPDAYAEEEVRSIEADFFDNLSGTHHFHSDGTYSVFDFCERVKS